MIVDLENIIISYVGMLIFFFLYLHSLFNTRHLLWLGATMLFLALAVVQTYFLAVHHTELIKEEYYD